MSPGELDMKANRRSRSESDHERHRLQVQQVLAGDQSAFSKIYEAFSPKVYAFIRRRVGGFPEVEDLTQETFVQHYRSLGSFEGRSSLLTWTFGIAHNVCSRHFRNSSRWMVGLRDGRMLEDVRVEATIEQTIDAARLLERCDQTLERSRRPAHREIFQLRYGSGQTIRAIAENVGRSRDSVKVSLRRSRALLIDDVPELDQVVR
jgi:RNA polymerase sigma-70 factor (ECF subfamily)